MLQRYKSLLIGQKKPQMVPVSGITSVVFQLLFLLFWLLLLPASQVLAQTHRTCATVEVNEALRSGRLGAESSEQFEQWLEKKIQQATSQSKQTEAATIYTIPVVVHVIHNGEAVGTGTNISDAQVQSQIRILNEDYRRKQGTRGYNTNPVGADTEIEFKLALSDPDRFPTSGIVRVRGTKQSWSPEDEATLKALSYWSSEHYLNIWVCNLESNTLGFAQFPESDQISGISAIGEEEARLDGVVIGYKYFGDEGAALATGNDFRYGRTTTHEIGHFLGLRHIWGDAPTAALGCNFDDYCQDTPNARQANYDCPSSDSTTCTTPKMREMVENYMDYTDDACMNVFTKDQKLRMRTVLENSPRRLSLLTSPGLTAVTLLADNASIEKLLQPETFLCENTTSPVLVLRNYGSNPLTELKLNYGVQGGNSFQYTWTGNLATAERDTIILPAMQVGVGSHTFQVDILSANGHIDEDASNNVVQAQILVSMPKSLPFWVNFDKTLLEEDWIALQAANSTTWRDTLISSSTNTSNKAAYLKYYLSTSTETQDVLLTAPYDLSATTQAYLMFDVSYARRGTSEDGLAVVISTDCGNGFTTENIIYQKSGSRLATTSTTSSQAWYPTSENHWREETISLTPYIGQKSVRFAFIGSNGQGNNIYLDNIRVVFHTETIEEEVNGYRELAKALQIYPNPSQGRFNLIFKVYEPKNVQIRIFNIIGQQVFSDYISQAEDAYEVDLSDLPAGMYLVNATSGQENITKKIVIAH